ncbi:MAG: tetraacyldisaccharide 4'-kinase [Candidatus Tokpelaia sp. JSC161]|jgi:tetraacyldisaccharide 4'-kinase|nr:MAG: tetraacyldisaccharide 4'-kinase [Candidatus Tokpelaia sp. JSC161]
MFRGKSSPLFWWRDPGFLSRLLIPSAKLYSYFAARNMRTRIPLEIDLPVLCIGNFTLGGSGKTPVVISFAQTAGKLGYKPGILSRGFGGSFLDGAHVVDINKDSACFVGDEALLLAEYGTVVVSHNRYIGARLLKKIGCDLILMDDGFQSRRLYPDYALLVVDGMRGFGNGKVFPSGPLRAPLITQFCYTDSILVIDCGKKLPEIPGIPVFYAILVPLANGEVENKRFLSFTGIGNPKKFFRSVKVLGGMIEQERIFPDHHFFREFEVKDIAENARLNDLHIATTAKDYMRLRVNGLYRFLDKLIVFDIHVDFKSSNFCEKILEEVISRYKGRMRDGDLA